MKDKDLKEDTRAHPWHDKTMQQWQPPENSVQIFLITEIVILIQQYYIIILYSPFRNKNHQKSWYSCSAT